VVAILKRIRESKENVVLIVTYNYERSEECSNCLKSSSEARRRFPDPIHLKDYSESEMMQLARRMMKKRGLHFEGGLSESILRILAGRALRRSGDSDFKNMHALEFELDALSLRQVKRYDRHWIQWAKQHSPEDETSDEATQPQQGLITRDDIFNPMHSDIRKSSSTWKEIHAMVSFLRFPPFFSFLVCNISVVFHSITGRVHPSTMA
jgi:hypothetical protein